MSGNLRDLLTAVRDEFGSLTPELVVDVARDPDHPLHSRFEWDDTIAGEMYRVTQAGQLLRVVKLPNDGTRPGNLRAFLVVRPEDGDSRRAEYVPTEEALLDPFTRRLVLADMAREWKLLKRRYEHMAEFADLILRDLTDEAS